VVLTVQFLPLGTLHRHLSPPPRVEPSCAPVCP
jgi:hypothetical protein